MRRHINVFVNGERAAQETHVEAEDRDRRPPGDLRRLHVTELLVGTKKGLFVLEGEPGSGFEVTARAFAGEPVEYALRDPRSGRLLAAVSSPFYGPKVFVTDDPAGEWEQATGIALPEGGEQALERIWILRLGEADGQVFAGGDPGVLFESRDGGSELRAQPRAVGAPHAAEVAAGRRRAVPALDRDVARRPRPARDRDLGRRRVADRRRRRRAGARATRACGRATCRRTRRRTRSACACTGCAATRGSRSGSSCSSTAASTAPTTRARAGATSRPACRRTSASRSPSTPPTPTARS